MDFNIAAGSAANLPKEMVDKIVEEAVEKSVVLKLVEGRGNYIEIVNEGTIPVLGVEDLEKVYCTEGVTDITTLSEMDFDIKSPDLRPRELGTHIYLKKKHVQQYPGLKLDQLFEQRISRAIARSNDFIMVKGDTTASPATNKTIIADGLEKLSNAANVANAAVTYSTSNTQTLLNAVNEGVNGLGLYGDDEYAEDIVALCSPDFITAARNSANKNFIGYEVGEYAPLGKKNVIFLHGVPLLKRSNLTGEKAILANMAGAYAAYFGNIEVDVEHKAARRADLLVVTFWFDFKWALTNGSAKNEGLIVIEKSS